MKTVLSQSLRKIFPCTSRFLAPDFLCPTHTELPKILSSNQEILSDYPFLPDLASIELAVHRLQGEKRFPTKKILQPELAKNFDFIPVSFSNLPQLLQGEALTPTPEEGHIFVVGAKEDRRPHCFTADKMDLLALKIVVDQMSPQAAARAGNVPVRHIYRLLERAEKRGIIVLPPSAITRPKWYFDQFKGKNSYLRPTSFTLQWHITQRCDLHCRHCYDRTSRKETTLDEAKSILDQFLAFCEKNRVEGQVSFTGGNPLLHPHFLSFYAMAVERGFKTALLANPTSKEMLTRIQAIQALEFFQVSLEGLSKHNDYIRGRGHFAKTLDFLSLLRELSIYSVLMLTLTKANLDQTITLAKFLADRVDNFNFNRLALFGEGASLAAVPPEQYQIFLENYLDVAFEEPTLGLKESLFNPLLEKRGKSLANGCTGHGCGAAFNFVSVLPDGEVHACRKFPSLLGNIHHQGLDEIYTSRTALAFRSGNTSCRQCRFAYICGGCAAVTASLGGNPLHDRDPYCTFFSPQQTTKQEK